MIGTQLSRIIFNGTPSVLISRQLSIHALMTRNDTISSKLAPARLRLHNLAEDVSSSSKDTPVISKGLDGWQIMASICVSRHPVMCPPMSPIENSYSEHLNKIEVEQSVLSDFELKLMEDDARKMLGEDEMEEIGGQELDQQSALELLDMWTAEKEEFEKIKSTDYETPDNSVGVFPSRQVILAQKYTIGSQDVWLLPQGPWQPGETLRQTSERIVAECCDPSLGVRIMGNAPIGFYKYKYPKQLRAEGYLGAKVFFYRGYVGLGVRRSLKLLQAGGRNEQRWLTRDQIKTNMQKSYANAICQFIINDE